MGFFKIDRDLLSHYLWKDTPFSKGQAWIDLIGLACYKDSTDMYNGQIIHCERGKVYKTYSYLSRRWGWSRKKVTSFIRALEGDGMVTTKATTHGTTITIVNYGVYQNLPSSDKYTNKTSNKTSRKTSGKTRTTINNNEEQFITSDSPPSDEVAVAEEEDVGMTDEEWENWGEVFTP
jgi:DNA replication protein DnaD